LRVILVALFAAAILAACGWGGARPLPADAASRAADARTLAETAARIAVSKAGAKVCRQMAVGISERDWIRGVVVEVSADRIRVRIDELGRYPQTLDGVVLASGVAVWDSPLRWTPCA